MRYFILSDVHANQEALEAVITDMHSALNFQLSIDRVFFLGDVVGYNPNPNETMDMIWQLANTRLIGNHDLGVYWCLNGKSQTEIAMYFNESAHWALNWTARQLSAQNKERLTELIEHDTYFEKQGEIMFAHATPTAQKDFSYYICDTTDAFFHFFRLPQTKNAIAFVGHTHIPQLYFLSERDLFTSPQNIPGGIINFRTRNCANSLLHVDALPEKLPMPSELNPLLCLQKDINSPMEKSWKFREYAGGVLVVVPAVGQPRDGLNYAGYAVYNTQENSLLMRRFPYDFQKTQQTMRKLNFPERLWQRLSDGR